jgi:thioredoxin 1
MTTKNMMELTDANFSSTVAGSGVPVLVDFWAPWCGPCRLLTPIVEEMAQAYDGKIQVAKVNTDESPAVAGQYGIRSIPTLLLFKNGEVVDSHVGVLPKNQLQEKIDKVLGS